MGANRPANVADRRSNMQSQISESRGERMENRQGSRQDYMNNRREDWQDFHNDHAGHWGDWHHGNWAGNWGDWWDHMWDEHPGAMALGVTRWGLNRVGSWYGYGGYYENPYYSDGDSGSAPVDYSQPVSMSYDQALAETANLQSEEPTPLPPGVTQASVDQFEQARAAFYDGHYTSALAQTDAVLKQLPSDAVVNEFRALCLFALKRYKESAAVLNAVLAVGPGWDWTTLSGMYAQTSTYTAQLRALEDYCEANPNSADAAFVLGYQYLTMGHSKEAKEQFAVAVRLQPKDAVAAYLLQSLSPPAEKPAAADPAPAALQAAPTIAADQLVGTWTATGPGAAKYVMTLTKDGAFTWAYTKGPKKQTVKGAYVLDGSDIAMDVDAGGKMLATLSLGDGGALGFRMAGGPKDDKGLEFKKG
ncbi:MAG TPA: tetratricopeptide repeat protein [Planctomycetia bacterium]|nr:tetratricopeptide repeat protein [Planctomycetia bacterium]